MLKSHLSLILLLAIILVQTSNASGRFNYIYKNTQMRGGAMFMPFMSSGKVIGETQFGRVTYNQKFGNSFGLIGSYKFGMRNFVEAGFSHQTQILNYNQNKTASFSFLNNAIEKSTTVRFSSISVPLRLLFYDSQYRLRRYMSVGTALNFMYSRKQHETYVFENNYQETNAYNNKGEYRFFSPELRMGFGFEYDLDQELCIKLEPIVGMSFYRGGSKINMITLGLLLAAQIQG
jgi:hypothetical protein